MKSGTQGFIAMVHSAFGGGLVRPDQIASQAKDRKRQQSSEAGFSCPYFHDAARRGSEAANRVLGDVGFWTPAAATAICGPTCVNSERCEPPRSQITALAVPQVTCSAARRQRWSKWPRGTVPNVELARSKARELFAQLEPRGQGGLGRIVQWRRWCRRQGNRWPPQCRSDRLHRLRRRHVGLGGAPMFMVAAAGL